MPRLQRKSLERPEEVRAYELGRFETWHLDDVVLGRFYHEPGWRWSTHVRPVAGTDRCQYHHLGVCVSGTLHVEMLDGLEMEIPPGTAFEIPPGHDAWVVGDDPWVAYDFAGGRTYGRRLAGSGERVLATILLTDIVDSTATAERVGHAAWRELLARHFVTARAELDRFRGREVHTTGDGILALFDGSERAIKCGAAIARTASDHDLQVRCGVHTGEVELVSNDVRGVAVHIASRIAAQAAPGEVLVSGSTVDLVADSGLRFVDRGIHHLKGISGARQLWALAEETG